MTLPAPTRGLIENENLAYMQPGGAMVVDNWFPTIRGLSCVAVARGGAMLPDDGEPVISAFEYSTATIIACSPASATDLWDVTTNTPVLVQARHAVGNYAAAQLSNAAGRWMLVVNEPATVRCALTARRGRRSRPAT